MANNKERSDREELCHFMMTILSHDVSNFNQTSRGYLEMLLDEQMGTLSDEQARALSICLRQTKRIQDLIEAVRLIEELDGTPPKLKTIDLDGEIQEAIRRVQDSFREREIRVRFAPEGRSAKDEGHLSTMFTQLLSNSVRHNSSDVVEIEIDVSSLAEGPSLWKVVIADNGEGVSPEKAHEIFNRIEKRRIHGSGFGLPFVQVLASRLGGKVWLEQPKAGVGAAFALTLPRG
jgi:signal transduction histidine kinase